MLHAEVAQILLNPLEDFILGVLVAALLPVLVGSVRQGRILFEHLLRDVGDVAAAVVILGFGHGASHEVAQTVPHGHAENAHLAPSIVDVVLGGHVVAGPAQDAGQAVARGCAAAVSHVQGAGGIGGNVFNEGFAAAADGGASEGRAFLLHLLHHPAPEDLGERHVAEAGTRHLNVFHAVRVIPDPRGQFGRYVARRPVQGLRKEHGQVGGHVTVLRILRGLHNRLGRPFEAFFLKEAAEG